MTRRRQKRADEIRAEVHRYVEKLDRGEISNEVKPAGIGFSVPKELIGEAGNREIAETAIAENRRQLSSIFNGVLSFNEVQPSQQPSAEKGDRDQNAKS